MRAPWSGPPRQTRSGRRDATDWAGAPGDAGDHNERTPSEQGGAWFAERPSCPGRAAWGDNRSGFLHRVSGVHLGVEDTDDRHHVGNDSIVNDVLLDLKERSAASMSSRGRPIWGFVLSVANAWSNSARYASRCAAPHGSPVNRRMARKSRVAAGLRLTVALRGEIGMRSQTLFRHLVGFPAESVH